MPAAICHPRSNNLLSNPKTRTVVIWGLIPISTTTANQVCCKNYLRPILPGLKIFNPGAEKTPILQNQRTKPLETDIKPTKKHKPVRKIESFSRITHFHINQTLTWSTFTQTLPKPRTFPKRPKFPPKTHNFHRVPASNNDNYQTEEERLSKSIFFRNYKLFI